MKTTDIVFALLALVAAGCFVALVTLQVMEYKYYEKPVNVWDRAPHLAK